MPDIVGLEYHKPTSLGGIAQRAAARKDHRFQNLYGLLDAGFLWQCWDDLNKNAASGVDRVTAQAYEEDLLANLADLAERLKAKRYRAKLVRRCYIPKPNGDLRPLGIPALEDKLVQLACARILEAIYEQDFLPVSYGYRRERGARDAVADLGFNLQFGRFGYVVEADIQGFFDHLDHTWLMRMLAQRIDDQAFLHLIRKWLKAGVLDVDGAILLPEEGSPQGGVISPILANIYLHYALDLWFKCKVRPHCRGQAMLIRYADDFVCAFQHESEAKRFYRVLPERLKRFGLQVAPAKTRILRFTRFLPGLERRFAFLGFELYWEHDRQGVPRVMKRTARKTLQRAKQKMTEWIKANRHLPGRQFVRALNRKLVGHYQYFGLRTNSQSLSTFYHFTIGCAFKWLNRRGGKKASFSWPAFNAALKKLRIALPRIVEQPKQRVVYA
jgi:RNA-directed DNA polymerase